jgi:uncharacterized protein (TIGR02246 family)
MASTCVRYLFLSLALGVTAPVAAQTADDSAIRELIHAQETAFDAHDAAAYGQSLESDADMVTPSGTWLKGRDAYTVKLAELFKGPLGAAHVRADNVTIRMLGAGLALAHVTWVDTADRDGGSAIESQVVRRQSDGRWLIAAAQETDVAPEHPAARTTGGGEEPTAAPKPARKCLLARGNGDCLIYK